MYKWKWRFGQGVGGSSLVNIGVYTRGNLKDYTAWGGPENWSVEQVLELYKSLELDEGGATGLVPQSLWNKNLAKSVAAGGKRGDNLVEVHKRALTALGGGEILFGMTDCLVCLCLKNKFCCCFIGGESRL